MMLSKVNDKSVYIIWFLLCEKCNEKEEGKRERKKEILF